MSEPELIREGSSEPHRAPFSPKRGDNMYNRLNFMNKLQAESKSNPNTVELKFDVPDHILSRDLFFPLGLGGPDAIQGSGATITSIWNTMIGSTILTMPWGMQESGIIVGVFLIVLIGLIARYTSWLVVTNAQKFNVDDVSQVVEQVWGKKGRQLTVIMSCLIMIGAAMAYFVLINSAFFGVIDAFVIWGSGNELDTASWAAFSERYTPFVLVGVIYPLSIMKEKSSFVKINSGGIFFVIFNVGCLLAVGFRALAINTFTTSGSTHISSDDKGCDDDWNCVRHNPDVHIDLFSGNWAVLSGMLTTAFFSHNFVVVIMKNNHVPANNYRDLWLGYCATGGCYLLIGVLGYFGFRGNGFPQGDIEQNCLQMFASDNPFAFVIRLSLLIQLTTVLPFIYYIIRIQYLSEFYGSIYPSKFHVNLLSAVLVALCVLIAVVYPNVGTIISFTGAVVGFYFVFLVPCWLYLQLTYPKTDQENPLRQSMTDRSSPDSGATANIDEQFETDTEIAEKNQRSKSMTSWRFSAVFHICIIALGVMFMVYQFVMFGMAQ